MSGRETILGKIRENLARSNDPSGKNAASEHIQAHQVNLKPKRGDLDRDQRVELFCSEASRVNASIDRVSDMSDVPECVSEYLRQHQLPATVKIAPHPALKNLSWENKTSLMVDSGRGEGDDGVSVSVAFGGVAETGTLVMTSGADTPTSLNFLPLDHIVVVNVDDIAGDYEAVWERIRQQRNRDGKSGTLPRTVNWITGPSRTADIEQTLLLGAHGPQRLHIIVVDTQSG